MVVVVVRKESWRLNAATRLREEVSAFCILAGWWWVLVGKQIFTSIEQGNTAIQTFFARLRGERSR